MRPLIISQVPPLLTQLRVTAQAILVYDSVPMLRRINTKDSVKIPVKDKRRFAIFKGGWRQSYRPFSWLSNYKLCNSNAFRMCCNFACNEVQNSVRYVPGYCSGRVRVNAVRRALRTLGEYDWNCCLSFDIRKTLSISLTILRD